MSKSSLLVWSAFGLCLIAGFNVAGEVLSLSVRKEQSELVLSWPSWASDAVLEQCPLQEPFPAWSPVPRSLYQSNAAAFSFRTSTTAGSRLFRVRRVGPPVAGLSGHWTLDGSTGLLGLAGFALNATNVTWAAGRFGAGSLQLNGQAPNAGGSLAWVSNANYQVLPPAGQPFSLSLWFSPDALGEGPRTIFGTALNGTNGWQVTLHTVGPGTNELILVGAANGTSSSLTGRTLLLPTQWHRLIITSESNQAKLYLDSSLIAEGSLALLNGQGPLFFGGIPGASSGFPGRLDEIRIHTNALTPEQISLTGDWHFDDNGGGLATDASVQGHLASVTESNAWTSGKSGSGIDTAAGLVMISNEDYRVLPASGGAFSISAWVRPRALPIGRSGLLSCVQGTNGGWSLCVEVENSGSAWLEWSSTNQGGTLGLRAPFSYTNNSWTRLDLTYNGGMASLYVNGRKIRTESGALRASEAPLVVGTAPGAANFNGVIDELKVYSRERSDSEIGPVALPMWETAFVNSSTNFVLPGAGPPGKPLTYSLVSVAYPPRGVIHLAHDSPIMTYDAGGQKGPDSFVYTVSDGEFTSAPATGVVSVVQPHWVSPSGGPLEPRDGSSPARAWAGGAANVLDQLWRTNNYYDCFFYAPGEYQTTGWEFNQRATANPGCKHIGSGREGPAATTIKLVNTWSAWGEGIIFAALHGYVYTDGFEVHDLVLDCNALNNPKYVVGEPVWLRIPLTTTGWVERVTLHWSESPIAGNASWRCGPPAEFNLCTRASGPGGFVTNCLSVTNTESINDLAVGALTDEVLVKLNRRANGADFYALQEMEIQGAAVSLPAATRQDGGASRLDLQHSILLAVDQDPATSWASGPESQVQIALPLESGAVINQIEFQWNCQTLPDLRRLGPAAQFVISAREPGTGQLRDVPFVTTGRTAGGRQIVTFGTEQSTNSIVTDQLVILLMARESGVGFYSLKEISLRRDATTVAMRLPRATSTLTWSTNYSIIRAFDGEPSAWASGTQGALSGIDVRGSNLKFTGLKLIGFGTKALRECFPLAVIAHEVSPTTPPVRNILVEDCLVTQPAPSNPDGMSAIAVVGAEAGSVHNAVIRRCSVIGVANQFTYSHGFGGNWIENCFVDDCQVGAYFEPTINPALGYDSIGPATLRSNRFVNVVRGVSVDFHPGAHLESLVCLGNEIVLSGRESRGYGVGACDTCSAGIPGTITNLTALNNIIRYPGWTARPSAPEEGLVYGDVQHAIYGNNVIALGTQNELRVRQYPAGQIPATTTPEDCDHPGLVPPGPPTIPPSLDPLFPGYRRAWYNNRDLSGVLLPVRHRFFGVDRPALQQQWPE